jgi:hypothetical protein
MLGAVMFMEIRPSSRRNLTILEAEQEAWNIWRFHSAFSLGNMIRNHVALSRLSQCETSLAPMRPRRSQPYNLAHDKIRSVLLIAKIHARSH